MPGVCRIPEGAKLFTAQRFDDYDGVSWMVHTDGNQEQLGRAGMVSRASRAANKAFKVEFHLF